MTTDILVTRMDCGIDSGSYPAYASYGVLCLGLGVVYAIFKCQNEKRWMIPLLC